MSEKTSTKDMLLIMFIGFPLVILVTFYRAFVIGKVMVWFDLPIHFTFRQLFGILAIYSIVTLKADKSEINTLSDVIKRVWENCISLTIILIIYYLITFFI